MGNQHCEFIAETLRAASRDNPGPARGVGGMGSLWPGYQVHIVATPKPQSACPHDEGAPTPSARCCASVTRVVSAGS
eukprot:CAMPEP_0174351678 /NCGR_PEP_ID=MMETSP0811_2-20130205/9092_1 /TAXON_ID=73025 ORGANISM="Eutreptiella gymnastica-like, Strain CCMP1594" /NCGR_SAMPLE_ID=MMETSP0811_2 /ASSEMBLY_ACC=CAM_ASM_000667 /LENGTH=76 /DNA_ID=CAMNT_0015481103 /DNA_START=461 /DNA_END=688 /DNA_ORIENTATION=-